MNMEQLSAKYNKLLGHIFFSNYFYGLCAVALSIEAALQQRIPLNGILYFFLIFITTVLYYGYPYIRKCSAISSNPRTNWYIRHYKLVRWNQIIITIILLVSLVLFLWNYWEIVLKIPSGQWLLIFIFPIVAALYHGINFLSGKYSLRKIGWLKPFIIGFTWAGMVTVYPVLFYDIMNNLDYIPGWITVLLFLKNFMFITVLCIMFDIKDYAADYVSRLKTFVVKIGLRKTIFCILLPLSLLGLGSFIYYAAGHQFHRAKIVLNIIPFVLLIIVSFSLCRRRSIMYYLVIIDGLMLIKAVCGSIAMTFF
jgi:hypothetical protein